MFSKRCRKTPSYSSTIQRHLKHYLFLTSFTGALCLYDTSTSIINQRSCHYTHFSYFYCNILSDGTELCSDFLFYNQIHTYGSYLHYYHITAWTWVLFHFYYSDNVQRNITHLMVVRLNAVDCAKDKLVYLLTYVKTGINSHFLISLALFSPLPLLLAPNTAWCFTGKLDKLKTFLCW